MHDHLALKNFSHCHRTVEFSKHVTRKTQKTRVNSLLYLARHIAMHFYFPEMKFVKSKHHVTLQMNVWENLFTHL